jgi:hypothetical protein
MRRVANAAVLIVCLGAFVCPAVGKANVIPPARQHTSCEKTDQLSDVGGGCAGKQSQPNHCCPVPCSTLILYYVPVDGLSTPAITEQLVFSGDTISSIRRERPPVPPPRA